MWCIRFDRAGFRVGPSAGRHTKEHCAGIIFDLRRLVIEWVHIHRSIYFDGTKHQQYSYDVPIPKNHAFELSLEILYLPEKLATMMMHNAPQETEASSSSGVANQQHSSRFLTGIQENDEEEESPRRSVQEIASGVQEASSSQKPIVPDREALIQKGVILPPLAREAAESSKAAAVPPINLKRIQTHGGAEDKTCPHCHTIGPSILWEEECTP